MRLRPLRTKRLRGVAMVALATVAAATFLVQAAPSPQADAAAPAPVAASAAGKTVELALAPAAVKSAKPVVLPFKFGTKKYNRWYANKLSKTKYHWNYSNFVCLSRIYDRESGWNQRAHNRSGAHGIPQAMPGKKMAKFGKDWRTNPNVQIAWGLNYIHKVYKTPCRAWSFWRTHHWY